MLCVNLFLCMYLESKENPESHSLFVYPCSANKADSDSNVLFFLVQDFKVLTLLGKGSFACVYRAKSMKTGLDVAIKTVKNLLTFNQGSSCERFKLKTAGLSDRCFPQGASCGPSTPHKWGPSASLALWATDWLLSLDPTTLLHDKHADAARGRRIIISVVPICRLTKKRCTKLAWSSV